MHGLLHTRKLVQCDKLTEHSEHCTAHAYTEVQSDVATCNNVCHALADT